MTTVHAGAGGWGYFAGGLPAYARAFRFAEVNATFYRQIPEARARSWRRQVPEDFVFSVKGNREITHTSRLRATPAARDALGHDVRLARILRARFVVLETPASLEIGPEQVRGFADLVLSVRRGPRIGLEARAYVGRPLPPRLARAMEDLQILDVVDLSKGQPRVPADVVYTRLFGHGEHNRYEFDDDELRAIDRAGRDAVEVAFTFHGVRMYHDAARFLTFRRTGRFPRVTETRSGLESLASVLRDDVRFPMTKGALIRAHGWKVFDADDSTRLHARDVLRHVPDRTYRSVADVLGVLLSRMP